MANSLTDEPTTLAAAIARYNATGKPIPKALRAEQNVRFVSGTEKPRKPAKRRTLNRRYRISSVPFSRMGGALPLTDDGQSPAHGSRMPTPHQNARIHGYSGSKSRATV